MNEQLSKIISNPHRDKALIGLGSLLVGAGIGFAIGLKRGRKYTAEEMDHIDAAVRQMTSEYRDTDLPDEVIKVAPAPVILDAEDYEARKVGEDFVRSTITSVRKPNGDDEIVDIPIIADEDDEPAVVAANVFAGSDDDWNYELEVTTRTEQRPYVLHKDEFYADEKDYEQVTLTYYAGDNIMTTDDDQIVYNHEDQTGPMRFGHGSGDTKVFYVRNDKNKAEYEIVRHEGTYSEEVLGLEIENNARAVDLKHERSPGKFRQD
jgi:hypothetical protein